MLSYGIDSLTRTLFDHGDYTRILYTQRVPYDILQSLGKLKIYDPSGYSGETNEKGHTTSEEEEGKTPSAGTEGIVTLKQIL